jgi:hypothetical protein
MSGTTRWTRLFDIEHEVGKLENRKEQLLAAEPVDLPVLREVDNELDALYSEKMDIKESFL